MKERLLRRILRSLNGKNSENPNKDSRNLDQELKKKKEIISYLYDSVESHGQPTFSVDNGYLFDKLRAYKTQILTTKENKKYNLSLHVDRRGEKYLTIADYKNEGGNKRKVVIKEIFKGVYSLVETSQELIQKEDFIKNPYFKNGSMSPRDLGNFINEVDQAEQNPDLSRKKAWEVTVYVSPEKN